jgi:hypothetical protein
MYAAFLPQSLPEWMQPSFLLTCLIICSLPASELARIYVAFLPYNLLNSCSLPAAESSGMYAAFLLGNLPQCMQSSCLRICLNVLYAAFLLRNLPKCMQPSYFRASRMYAAFLHQSLPGCMQPSCLKTCLNAFNLTFSVPAWIYTAFLPKNLPKYVQPACLSTCLNVDGVHVTSVRLRPFWRLSCLQHACLPLELPECTQPASPNLLCSCGPASWPLHLPECWTACSLTI